MTTVATDGLRSELARSEIRDTIARLVAARVPQADAGDVVQTALCAALAASHVPDEPRQRTRWLTGIARHKIADYYRRVRRVELCADLDMLGPSPAYEVADLLENIAAECDGDARAQQTLEWIVREHQGEPLAEIARNENLSPTAIRQRVSRMRRALRAKWLLAAVVVSGAMVLGVVWHDHAQTFRNVGATTSAEWRPLQGRWAIVHLEADASVPAETKSFVAVLTSSAQVTVVGQDFTIQTPSQSLTGQLRLNHGDLVLVGPGGREQAAHIVEQSAERLVLRVNIAGWAGTVSLER